MEENQSENCCDEVVKYEPLVEEMAAMAMPCDHICVETDEPSRSTSQSEEEGYSRLANTTGCESNMAVALSAPVRLDEAKNIEIWPTQSEDENYFKSDLNMEEHVDDSKLNVNAPEPEYRSQPCVNVEERNNKKSEPDAYFEKPEDCSKSDIDLEEPDNGFKVAANVQARFMQDARIGELKMLQEPNANVEEYDSSKPSMNLEKTENCSKSDTNILEAKTGKPNQKSANAAKNNRRSDPRLKKSDEKPTKKAPAKKELASKQRRKSSVDLKPSEEKVEKDEKVENDEKVEKDEKKEPKTDKRRRSNRLKSKPDYNDKLEEERLLATIRNEEKIINEVVAKSENSQPSLPNGENVSAKISIEVGDRPPFQHIVENEYFTERLVVSLHYLIASESSCSN